jgi:hypothetical protein
MHKAWRDRLRGIDREVNKLKANGLPGIAQLLVERRAMMMKRRRFMFE